MLQFLDAITYVYGYLVLKTEKDIWNNKYDKHNSYMDYDNKLTD